MAAEQDIRKIRHGFGNVGKKIDTMLAELEKLKTIPTVVQKEARIQQMRDADLLFDHFSLDLCEQVRLELRDLMQYIPDDRSYYMIDAKDFVVDVTSADGQVAKKTYAEKAQDYILAGCPALSKIRNLDTLTQQEKHENQ